METTAILLVCCALAAAAAGQGEPCTVDEAGNSGDCRPISQCPKLLQRTKMVNKAQNRKAEINRLRELVSKCPVTAVGGIQICCQNEVTHAAPPSRVELPTKPNCGQRFDPRVIAGEDATVGEFPWMASIQYSIDGERPLIHGCGASLITSRHVLTAAHCVTGLYDPRGRVKVEAVVLGELNFNSERDCFADSPEDCADPPITVGVDRIFIHAAFQNIITAGLPNDIAVVRLANEVTFTKYIKPVCLMTDLSVLPEGKSDNSPGLRGIVSGWGQSEIGSDIKFTPVLQKAIVPIRPTKMCERELRQRTSLERHLCAGNGVDGADTCRGDSGGPLIVPVSFGEFWYQTGVTSFGSTKCGRVAGYVRVFNYRDWIVEQINK